MPFLLAIPAWAWLVGGGAVAGAGATYVVSDTVKNVSTLALIAGAGYLLYKKG